MIEEPIFAAPRIRDKHQLQDAAILRVIRCFDQLTPAIAAARLLGVKTAIEVDL
jgi:hypothetical protein